MHFAYYYMFVYMHGLYSYMRWLTGRKHEDPRSQLNGSQHF